MPEIASRHHLELVNAGRRAARSSDAGADARRRRAGRRDAGPGPRRRAARRPLDRQGARGRAASCRSRPSTTCRATSPPTSSPAGDAGAVRAAVRVPDRLAAGTRCWRSSTEHDGFEVLGRTLDDAAGEAFDKGARMLGLGYPGRCRARAARRGRRPRRPSPSPGSPGEVRGAARPRKAFAEGLDFSFAGLKTALLYAVRELGPEQTAERAAPTSPPPTRRRSSPT